MNWNGFLFIQLETLSLTMDHKWEVIIEFLSKTTSVEKSQWVNGILYYPAWDLGLRTLSCAVRDANSHCYAKHTTFRVSSAQTHDIGGNFNRLCEHYLMEWVQNLWKKRMGLLQWKSSSFMTTKSCESCQIHLLTNTLARIMAWKKNMDLVLWIPWGPRMTQSTPLGGEAGWLLNYPADISQSFKPMTCSIKLSMRIPCVTTEKTWKCKLWTWCFI